jgi:uncharacterized membrane protein YdbT with pleckstrin-like domain
MGQGQSHGSSNKSNDTDTIPMEEQEEAEYALQLLALCVDGKEAELRRHIEQLPKVKYFIVILKIILV